MTPSDLLTGDHQATSTRDNWRVHQVWSPGGCLIEITHRDGGGCMILALRSLLPELVQELRRITLLAPGTRSGLSAPAGSALSGAHLISLSSGWILSLAGISIRLPDAVILAIEPGPESTEVLYAR